MTTPSPSREDQDPLSRDLGDCEAVSGEDSGGQDDTGSIKAGGKVQKKNKKKKKPSKKGGHYELCSGTDVVGVIFLEINSITDLPPERNSQLYFTLFIKNLKLIEPVTRTGFDMDPFVVASLGKKTYRTRHIRHSLNPVFDEKMVFQVLRHEKNYTLNFAVVDRDKLSANDFVAQTNLALKDIAETQPTADPETGLYSLREPLKDELTAGPVSPGLKPAGGTKSRFRLPISRSASGTSLATKGNPRPELSRKNSFTSLRSTADIPPPGQVTEETTTSLSVTKITPVNDTTEYDLKSFTLPLHLKNKERWEDKHTPELFVKAVYVPYPALRQQFWRVMLRQYDADDSGMISRVELTTMLDTLGSTLSAHTIDSYFERFKIENGYDSLESTELTVDQAVICLEDQLSTTTPKSPLYNSAHPSPLPTPLLKVPDEYVSRDDRSLRSSSTSTGSDTPGIDGTSSVSLAPQPVLGTPGEEGLMLGENDLAEPGGKVEEHVIQLKECPLCHQPRLQKRSEVDIVTHLATCASQDWRQVDKLVMGGFVTSSQAQRNWYSKVWIPTECP